MRVVAILGMAVFLAACESDQKKIERVKYEEIVASSAVETWEARIDSLNKEFAATHAGAAVDTAYVEAQMQFVGAAADSLNAAIDRHDLTQRALNKFMRGE